MRYLLLTATIVFIGCNSDSAYEPVLKSDNETNKISAYPDQITARHVQDLYDSAKWYIYTYNCDKLYKPKLDSSLNIPFSALELRFFNFRILHDTLMLNFEFMDKEKIILPGMTRDFVQILSGVGFNSLTRKKIFMVGSGYLMNIHGDPRSRYGNPLQPEVIEFISTHKDELHPWFREEAKRRKIIE